MEKLYYKLLVLSMHYFAASAYCNISSEYIIETIYSGCPLENYYCDKNSERRQIEAVFITCINSSILETNEATNRYDYRYIVLKNSSIPTLSPTGYYWDYVRKLHLEETNTNEIIPGFFTNFDYLRELHFTKNKITKLTSGEFGAIVELRVLNLTENLIGTVAPNSFSGLLNLAILDLSKNKITNLPENIFEYQNFLFYVDVSNNMLKNLDGTLFYKQPLKTLNISYNYISDFQIKNLTKLEYLRFDHNILSSLPIDAFYNLNHLQQLDLSFNQIKQIPFGLFNDLSGLTHLDLSSNKMVLDFHTLSTLKSLQLLKFTNNTIKNFDVNILLNRFKYLESITLSNDRSWSCNELATAIHKLQFNNISVIRGQNTNESNILGISCKNSTDLFGEKNASYSPYYYTNDNVTSALLAKLMQNLNGYAANTSNSLTNIQTYMKKLIDTKSSDKNLIENVPWQNISLPLNEISNNIKQIFRINSMPMAKNVDSSNDIFNQTLINLTNSFNEISNNIKQVLSSNSVAVDKNMESKALISEIHEEIKTNNIGLILNNILLATILCCLILFAYRHYLKPKIINNSAQEQVQLM